MRDLPLPKASERAILAHNSPESGECRLNRLERSGVERSEYDKLDRVEDRCGGSPPCIETCSRYLAGRHPELKIFLCWMRVAALAGSWPGSPERIPRELYSDLISTRPLACAQSPRALAQSVSDRSTSCHSQMMLLQQSSAPTSCATMA